MRMRKITAFLCSILVMLAIAIPAGFACTIIAVGKDATVDGTAIITHNDDSSVADFRLWILRGKDQPEGSMRDIVIDSHDNIDYSKWPEINYGANRNGRAMVLDQDPQPAKTYDYLHSRYSFINANGVAMGESTFGVTSGVLAKAEYGKTVRQALYDSDEGVLDCWNAQDIVLERATTSREAMLIMGDLVNKYGWNVTGGGGELMDITDGDETWIMEFLGAKLWIATRMPDDMVWVGANSPRFNLDPRNPVENGVRYEVLTSPNFIQYAVDKGWYDPKSGKPFKPAEIYGNRLGYYNPREWRVEDLVAPSLGLKPGAYEYPYFVKPDKKLSVNDIWKISGDHYEGTEFDLGKGPLAGPFGDPLENYSLGSRPRPIGIPATTYLQISQVKPGTPGPLKGIVWYGYGSVGNSFVTPLFPAMEKLPDLYSVGSRYDIFRRDSGWWINTYVQEMIGLRYKDAIKDVDAIRAPKMDAVYRQTAALLEVARKQYATDPKGAVKLMSEFCYNTSIGWYADWLKLGDQLFAKYAMERVNFGAQNFPQWWKDWVDPAKNPELPKYFGK